MIKKSCSVFLFFIFVFLQCVPLCSCTASLNKYSSYSFDYFDTVTTIVGYEKTQSDFEKVSAEILDELEGYHRLFNIYQRFEGLENLCTVNELKEGSHRTVTVDKRIIDMLLYAKQMYFKTNGKVNIAMGSVLSIWHEYREKGSKDPKNASLPPTGILEDAAAHTDISGIQLDTEACTVTLTDPAMRLDVGAIAKGYAVEMIARALEEKNIEGYLLNVGGNVRVIGAKPDGSPWIIGIENSNGHTDEPYAAYLSLKDESVVTSGSYQRYYTVDGKRYHHIIDPETLFPAENFLSVSVICQSSATGDALSTALFCMSYEEGLSLVNSTEGVEAMWIFPDGEKRYSEGFSSYIV